MHSTPQKRSIGWKTVAAALGIGTVVVMLAVTMLGSQVSGILSTVGASVCSNCGYDEPVGQSAGSGGSGIVTAVQRDDAFVIKNGTMSVRVADITPAVTTSTDRIAALGGYASGSKRSGAGDELHASVTFRIPSAQWDAALNVLRGVGEVLDEATSTEDVTTKVVDLGARIRNLHVTELALQSIMDKASVVKDVLSVQAELTATRGEIEQLAAQKAHLEEQAAFSTLTATFFLPTKAAVVVAQTSGFDPAKEADAATAKLIRAIQHVARAGIWFGIVWLPILLALAIGVGFTYVAWRWISRWRGRLHSVDILGAGGAGSES